MTDNQQVSKRNTRTDRADLIRTAFLGDPQAVPEDGAGLLGDSRRATSSRCGQADLDVGPVREVRDPQGQRALLTLIFGPELAVVGE